MWKGVLVGLVIAIGVSACATSTIGADFNEQNMAFMMLDITTAGEARELLGAPAVVQTVEQGAIYTWQYIRADVRPGFIKTFVSSTQVKKIVLVFDRNDRLIKVQELINIPLDREARDRLQPVITKSS